MGTNSQDTPVLEWPDEHKTYWLGLASAANASLQHCRFAYAISTGMSQAAAARFADYKGDPRSAGYHAARTRAVKTLLALASGDGWKSPNAEVSEADKDKLLNELMVSNDPNARLRAIEQSDKRREREREQNRQTAAEEAARGDPLKTLDDLAEIAPLFAVLLASRHGFHEWAPPPILVKQALADIDDMRRMVMRGAEDADARAKPVAEAGSDAATDTGRADEAINGQARPAPETAADGRERVNFNRSVD